MDCDVYIAGHHGSASSSSPDFVKAMSPETSVISVGADNGYGHPAERTLSTLTENGSAIYRTDLQGEITISSDGHEYNVVTGKEPVEVENQNEITYVLNNNSRKFHRPDCESVEKIAEHNKELSYESREELIEQGYSPCGWCKP